MEVTPAAGSGTTCVAAEDLGIEWIGIEKEPHSAAIARKRIEQARRGQWTTRPG